MAIAEVAYDISAIMILLVSTLYFINKVPRRTVRFSIFVYIMSADLVAAIFDVARIMVSGMNLEGSFIWSLCNIVYYVSIVATAPLYLLYVIGVTDTWHIVKKKKVNLALGIVPVIIGEVVFLVSLFAPAIVSTELTRQLILRYCYYLVNVLVVVYVLIGITYISRLSKVIDKHYCRNLLIPLCVVSVAFIMQFIMPKHHLVTFAVAVNCLMLIMLSVKAEEALDITTGMYSFKMFADNMEMKLSTGKQMELILVNIINFNHALRFVGYDEMLMIMRPLAGEIDRILKGYHAPNTCYYNGEGKFAIELSRKHYPYIHEIASEIIKSINQNMQLEAVDFDIRINACRVSCPTDVSDVEALFMLVSDLEIYPSTGTVLAASDITSTDEFIMKKEMSLILDRALANHYFSVFYQPIYNVKEKRFASAEALIRLRDPKFGYISPGVFIPLAEKSGAIHAIGSFVIDEVCKFIASDEYKELGVDYIEINLSVMQCLRADLADEIIGTANKYGISPDTLNLEITETASAYSQEKLHGNIMALSAAGFKFSLDDFGTGYSNLMRITSLPLSIVKLDRTFVILEEKSGFHNTIKNLIDMLKDMGVDVLVEGIETKEMVEDFSSMGVDEIQGFYFSRPLTKTDYIRFVKKSLAQNIDNNS